MRGRRGQHNPRSIPLLPIIGQRGMQYLSYLGE
nr:MAG TPA: hypothetical protein [Caudoviricetes sp.]